MKRRFKAIALIFMATIFILAGCGTRNTVSNKSEDKFKEYKDNKLFIDFKDTHKGAKIIMCEYGDVTNDELKDLIVIYEEDKNIRLIVAVDGKNEIRYTNVVPAPLENQSIKLKNVDEKDQVEFIVSGSKKGVMGYGIFRVENMKIVDIFGEGMESCC